MLGDQEQADDIYLAAWRDAPAFAPLVRSAEATVLRLVRHAVIGTVRQRLTSADTPRADPQPVRRDRDDAP